MIVPTLRFTILCLGIGVAIASRTAQAAGSVDQGKVAAERICAACHVVGGQRGGTDAVPTFGEIVNDRKRSDDALRGLLAVQHGGMPDFQLTRQQIDDLVAYLRSLAND